MKQLLHPYRIFNFWIRGAQKWGAFIPILFALLIWGITLQSSFAQNIDVTAGNHAVSAVGTFTDLNLSDAMTKSISFELIGGDGGTAEVHDIGPVSFMANGGAGARTTATFPVGSGAGQIPVGSVIRFVEGERGESGSSGGVAGNGFSYGGGGGGSAVLYSPTGSAPWTLLAVAGGGSGGYQGMAAFFSVDNEDGQGGRSGTSGGSGNGDIAVGSGGSGGAGGGDGGVLSVAGAGGGANSAGGGITCISFNGSSINGEGGAGGNTFGYGGWSEGCTSFTWRNGGAGYGGGGAGSGAAGGGGGYSGGGSGGTTGRGGGGGSFVASTNTANTTASGTTTSSPAHGSITYSVVMNQPPVAICKNATINLDNNGNATLTTADIDNGSNDPDGSIASLSLSKTSFNCSNIGANQVTLTVTDNNGATATCEATVTVVDPAAPNALCKNITVQLNSSGVATITGADVNNGSTDNCSIASMTVAPNSFNCSNTSAPVTVTLTVTDGSGNFSTCTALVTVEDKVDPNAVCQNLTVYLDDNGEASISADDVDGGSTDNCSIDSKSIDVSDFDCGNVGTPVTVTLTVTDPSGNDDECEATVTVLDTVSPDAMCQNITVYLDGNGEASITADDVDGGSTDNCEIETKSIDISDFDCGNVGTPVTVTLTVTDPSGNDDECEATVTVLDTVSPDAVCQNLTVYLDDNGDASITADDVDGGSTDNCSIDSKSIDVSTFTCADVGTPVSVALTVIDPTGNYDKCQATVTVLDTVSPDAVCQNLTVYLNDNGNGSITADDVDGGSTDNCSIDSKSIDISAFTCENVGTPVMVTLTVTDPSGNDDKCQATVTVLDTVSPVALCKNIVIQLDADGKASIVATDIDNGSTDACGIATYVASRTDFTCADLGNNTVTLTVTDVNGNSSTCTANVRVEDNMAPLVRTKDIMVILEKDGEAAITPDMINNGSTDNCTIVSMWLSGQMEYDCGSTGVHEVTLHVRDQSGNVGSNTANVTVKFYVPDFKNKHNVANGDTIHRVDCQAPWDISRYDLDYETINKYAQLTTHVYKEELPENAPWGMYAIWRYEYVIQDACYHTYKFNYYLALYDLAPPIYSCFPRDTSVATSADVPPVDMKVKIIDVCQYVVWDTVITMPVLDQASGDTLGYTRRWMARDPMGHQSFKDQMIWLNSGNRNQYTLITGRIADEDHMAHARFAGEAGTNGLPVSLYRIDTVAGTRTWVSSWTTGDWMGAQGTYYFVPEQSGSYQVKIDTAICLVDTLKFNKWLWSDTLEVAAGESLDQGWVITHECTDTAPMALEEVAVRQTSSILESTTQSKVLSDVEWRVYPNPANSYLRLDINTDHQLNYRIYDALGRSVKMGEYHQGQTIDVDGLNAGVYHLQLRDQKEMLGTKRVLLIE